MRKWILAAIIGLLALAAVGSWGYSRQVAGRNLENYLNNKYQRAFYDLANQAQNLEVLLSKTLVASDPRLDSALLMDIRQQAAFAQSNLSQLPLNDALAGRTAKFLSQVGDYAGSLARQISQGEAIDSKNWDTLKSLYEQSVELNRDLQGIQASVARNNFYFGEMLRQVRSKLQKAPDNLARTDFQTMDERMRRYPALLYDGPFSEHLERAEPRYLSGRGNVGAPEAEQKALAFVDKRGGAEYQAKVTGPAGGRIPAHRVEVVPAGGGDGAVTVLDVSQQGGEVIWMLNSRPLGDQAVSIEDARRKAEDFLAGRGYGEMRSTYFLRQGNSATFNFAALQDGVTLYPDLVKLTVALDNGEVIGTETSGYLMSHRRRDLPKAGVSREQALAAINPRLEASGGSLALIPVGVTDEELAYEFQGKMGEDNYLIYVNAVNGREENVLKLIETPGGILTM
ncbi:MAG: Sporulation protein YpeB [Pelotomaculum sp. PtaU1.Bin035]|nr:MAG: Sporulation protein YpeB [Pelotomaculum sp. PtaU1.Bin035]